jgi:LCP family protein required for cell wall assembly
MPNKTKKSFLPTDRKSQIILGVLVLLGLLVGFGVSRAASNFVASMTILNLPGEPVIDESAVPVDVLPGEPTQTPTIAPPPLAVMPEPWDGKTRVNMLVMGVDARSPDATAPLSDTMILFTFDPVSNTAGMLSIPRDMWVKIPGGEYAKINTAFSVGEALKLPGGGPALATETVENFLGVPIQYYAQIDFEAFIGFIDHIAGVKLTIEEPIDLAFVDTGDFVSLEPGRYTLNGSYALAYVRNRDGGDGDIDRAKRQQQVILAIRDRLI